MQPSEPQSCDYCYAENVEVTEFRGEPFCSYCYGTFAVNEHIWKTYGFTPAESVILKSIMGAFNILEKRLKENT